MSDTTDNTATSPQTVLGVTGFAEGDQPGWQDKTVDGGPMVLENSSVGALAYGKTPLGYDQPVLHVNSGSPVLGYHFGENGHLYVVALLAGRWNLEDGEIRPEVVGGFANIDPKTGERMLPKKGAFRELTEETGLDVNDLFPTKGKPFVGDRAFFWKQVGEGNNVYVFELKPEHIKYISMSPQLQLMRWDDFVYEAVDGISMSAVARLMMGLHVAGLLRVVKA